MREGGKKEEEEESQYQLNGTSEQGIGNGLGRRQRESDDDAVVTSVKAEEAVHLEYGCFTVWTTYSRKLLETTSLLDLVFRVR